MANERGDHLYRFIAGSAERDLDCSSLFVQTKQGRAVQKAEDGCRTYCADTDTVILDEVLTVKVELRTKNSFSKMKSSLFYKLKRQNDA